MKREKLFPDSLFRVDHEDFHQYCLTSRSLFSCPLCTPESADKCDDQVKVFDRSHLREFSKKKFQRENSSKDLSKNWKMIDDDFVQVAILTNACLWSFAPQGLSKNGHLADGVLDLILIRPTNRKEFLRYVKRNGTSKDQFDLPFVELIRVKEVEITLKTVNDSITNGESTNSDDSSNDDLSDAENRSSVHRTHQPHPPSAPISEDSRRHRRPHHRISDQTPTTPMTPSTSKSRPSQSETDVESPTIDPLGSTTSLRRSGFFQNFKSKKEKLSLPRPFSSRTKDLDDEKSKKKLQRTPSKSSLRPSRVKINRFVFSPSIDFLFVLKSLFSVCLPVVIHHHHRQQQQQHHKRQRQSIFLEKTQRHVVHRSSVVRQVLIMEN